MATYYVNFVDGLDANNGLGPDASAATNKPWKTIGKLLGASGMASGDTAYLAPVVFREAVTAALTNPTVDTKIIGDPANAQGFKTSGGVLLSGGEVQWSTYTTNDTTAPSTSANLTLAGRNFLSFSYIHFVNGNSNNTINATTTAASKSINLTACSFFFAPLNQTMINLLGIAGVASNWTIDRCTFLGGAYSTAIGIVLPRVATTDYDANIVIKNSLFVCWRNQVTVASNAALTNKGGGVKIYNCQSYGLNGTTLIVTNDANLSTTFPCLVYNSVMIGHENGVSAFTSGQILEDYNYFDCFTPRVNVSTGTHSKDQTTYAPLIEIGQSWLQGRYGEPWGNLYPSGPLASLGTNATYAPVSDFLGRPRAASWSGANPAIGHLDRNDIAVRETTTVRTGANAIKIPGIGTQDFQVPVDAASTTVTVYGRYDTNHATTNKPQMSVVNGEECGVSTATATMTAAVDTWEQLSLTFTPTIKGVVTIRLVSRSAASTGNAFWDDFNIA